LKDPCNSLNEFRNIITNQCKFLNSRVSRKTLKKVINPKWYTRLYKINKKYINGSMFKNWYKVKVFKYLISKFAKIYKQHTQIKFGDYYMQVDIGSRLRRDAKRSNLKYERWSPIISSCVEIMAMKRSRKESEKKR